MCRRKRIGKKTGGGGYKRITGRGGGASEKNISNIQLGLTMTL